MKAFKELHKEYGNQLYLRLFLYPFSAVFFNITALVKSLYDSKVLLKGNVSDYPHFNANNAFNSNFYWTRALNLKWFGRDGISPYLGLGSYHLSRTFHYTLLSLNLYWRAGAVLILGSMSIWLLSHFIWIGSVNQNWLLIVLGMTIVSTTFYANLFRIQNYNSLGWAFFPLFLFGLFYQNWILVGISLFLMAFSSFTLVVIGLMFIAFCIFYFQTLWPVIYGIPAVIIVGLNFIPLFRSGKSSKILGTVIRAIGISTSGAKYVRKQKKFDLYWIYYNILYLQFAIGYLFISGELPVFYLIAYGIHLINWLVSRFADYQTIIMLMFTTALMTVISYQDYWLLIPFWLLASPLPGLIGFDIFKHSIDRVLPLKPFNIRPYLDTLNQFFENIPEGKRIMFAWDNPDGDYNKIFDGYRFVYEPALYAATSKRIHLFPDWWAIFELNYEDAPDVWGRDPESVKRKMSEWKADYVIIYQNDPYIDEIWRENGFIALSKMDWNQFNEDFANYAKMNTENLYWWLLKRRNS